MLTLPITPLSSSIKITFNNHSSILVMHLDLEDKACDSVSYLYQLAEVWYAMINCCWEGALPLYTSRVPWIQWTLHNQLWISRCDEYLKSQSGCYVVEQDKGIFARYEPRYLSTDAAGWALWVNTSTENMPTLPAVQFSLTMRIFQQSINFFKNSLQDTICLPWFDFRQLLFPLPWADFL